MKNHSLSVINAVKLWFFYSLVLNVTTIFFYKSPQSLLLTLFPHQCVFFKKTQLMKNVKFSLITETNQFIYIHTTENLLKSIPPKIQFLVSMFFQYCISSTCRCMSLLIISQTGNVILVGYFFFFLFYIRLPVEEQAIIF